MEKKQLLLGDVAGMTDAEVRAHIISNFSIGESELEPYEVLIAEQDEPDYEGYFYILLKHKESGEYYEVYGSHCSCYWYEDQFQPELSPKEYLLSDKNPHSRGGVRLDFLREILG